VSLEGIFETLKRAGRLGGRIVSPDAWYHAGMEERLPGDGYSYDGLKRPVDPARPFVVFQVTLSGWGCLEENGEVYRLEPGKAFLAVVPSEHRYFIPDEAESWIFFWLIIRHGYVARRLIERHRETGSVLTLSGESLLLARASALCSGGFRDRFAEEQELFSFLTEYDRHAYAIARGTPEREVLEEAVRRYALDRLDRPVDVTEVARTHGMSRSRFSHRFKLLVGESPARFLTGLRLEEAARLLSQTDDTLQTIAVATGFADANHLVKVFRRRYHTTPGAFRRQLRG